MKDRINENYFKNLLIQFVEAKGIKNPDVNSKSFIDEFARWIKDQQAAGVNYLELLYDLGLFEPEDISTAEIGKGKHDSIVLPYKTSIITPYTSGIKVENDRLVKADFRVFGDDPYIVKSNSAGQVWYKKINAMVPVTYMLQNPYDGRQIIGWENIHNSNNGDIVLGVYGNVGDKDEKRKIKQIHEVGKKLIGEVIEDYETVNGNYLYTIGSERKVKRYTHVKTYTKTR